MLRSFFGREEGQGLVEYALILLLIAVIIILLLAYPGVFVSRVFSEMNSGLGG